MPRLNTLNSLYKFIPAKLCHPMRICIEDHTQWTLNNWYGIYQAMHTYHIIKTDNRIFIRYENNYWNEAIINKYGKDS